MPPAWMTGLFPVRIVTPLTDLPTLASLFAVATIAAACDAIAGGGGLLTVPALLVAGLDPVAAIATNKLQGAAGTVSAAIAFTRRGLVDWRFAAPLAALGAAGGVAGALSVSLLPRPVLEALVPLLLVGIAIYFALAGRMRDEDARSRLPVGIVLGLMVPAVGFYDGIFGPGAGSFYTIVFVTLLGFGVLRATAHTKVANAASNGGSLILFALAGRIDWAAGLTMAAGAILGAQIGSALAFRHGARLIRPLLVLIATAAAAKLLADPANPLRQALTGFGR